MVRPSLRQSSFGARLYYCCFSNAFGREQLAFLSGQAAYHNELIAAPNGVALLRRNVHRIEKGLLMRPRRKIFAAGYIGETVGCYVRASQHACGEELHWARDVLREYFAVVESEPRVDLARREFAQAQGQPAGAVKMVPYLRDLDAAPSVGIDALLQLARRRRSVRWFLNKPVEHALIERALDVATLSPSACNRQPFFFHIIDEPALLSKVSSIPMGTAGYADNIPMFIVIVGRQRNYFDERDRHLIYIDGSLAAMSFILAIESLGLSSCCINWPDMESKEREMAAALNLSSDERPVMCLAVGYPDPEGMVAYSQKKSGDALRMYNLGVSTDDCSNTNPANSTTAQKD